MTPLKTQADLVKMLQDRKIEIQEVLSQRGFAVSTEDIMKAVEQGKVEEVNVYPGALIPFMILRKAGKTTSVENAVWAGSEPFETFVIGWASADYNYRFYVPKPCSNFWIERIAAAKPPEPAKPLVSAEPQKPAPEPAKPAPEPPKPAPAKEISPPAAVEVPGMFFVAGFFGKERMLREEFANAPESVGGRCAPLFGMKVGVLPPITEYLEAEASIGGKFNSRDEDNSSLFADLALNYLFPRCFVGGGVSFWDLTDSETHTVAMLAQMGVNITKNRQWQFVAEGRLACDELDNPGSNYMFWGGIRFRP